MATAELIVAELEPARRPALEFDKRLRERCFGEFEGTKYSDVAPGSAQADTLAQMKLGHGLAGSECNAEVAARVGAALEQIALDPANASKRVLVVSHGAAIAVFMRIVCRMDPMAQPSPVVVRNTALSKVVLTGTKAGERQWKLEYFGDTSHMDDWVVRFGSGARQGGLPVATLAAAVAVATGFFFLGRSTL